jgi:hypothetical protein
VSSGGCRRQHLTTAQVASGCRGSDLPRVCRTRGLSCRPETERVGDARADHRPLHAGWSWPRRQHAPLRMAPVGGGFALLEPANAGTATGGELCRPGPISCTAEHLVDGRTTGNGELTELRACGLHRTAAAAGAGRACRR